MNNFVMMVGLPASGKSTYIDNNLKGYTVFSSDEYRGRLFKTLDTTKEQNAKVFEIMHRDIVVSLKNKKDVVYDACNISSKRRKNYLESIKKYLKDYKKICTIIATPFETCIKNNNERNKYRTDAFFVPNRAITKMWKNFYIPYYFEGWDEINLIYNEDKYDGYKMLDYLKIALDFDQNNHHHTKKLGDHVETVASNFIELLQEAYLRYPSFVIGYYTGLLHDIGKIYTKTFDILTDESHYYNHANVGTYESLFYLKNEIVNQNEHTKKNLILFIAFLINYHMRLFNETEKESLRKFIGNDLLMETLEKLNKSDISAQ